MRRHRNICITIIFSILLHFSVLSLYPVQIAANVPDKREVQVVFKINRPAEAKIQPVSRKIKTINTRKTVKTEKPKMTPPKKPQKLSPVKPSPVKVIKRTIAAVEKKEVIEKPVFTAAPTKPKTTDDHEKNRFSFKALILGKIENNKIYPLIARKMGVEGDVLVSFTIISDGTVDDISVHAPSKCHRLLKKAAVSTIKKSAPYIPVPLNLQNSNGLRMKIKIAYKIT